VRPDVSLSFLLLYFARLTRRRSFRTSSSWRQGGEARSHSRFADLGRAATAECAPGCTDLGGLSSFLLLSLAALPEGARFWIWSSCCRDGKVQGRSCFPSPGFGGVAGCYGRVVAPGCTWDFFFAVVPCLLPHVEGAQVQTRNQDRQSRSALEFRFRMNNRCNYATGCVACARARAPARLPGPVASSWREKKNEKNL
jgi:hypothetical protein